MSENEVLEVIFKETTTKNGIFCQFDDHHGVLLLDIKIGHFSQEDFVVIGDIIDSYFKERGELAGLIVNSKKFPYWQGAINRRQYIEFAAQNHCKFKKAALNIGGFFVRFLASIAKGRAHPEIKIFKYNQIEKAQDWILQD